MVKKTALTALAVVSMGATAYAGSEQGVVNTDVLNVRSGPGTNYSIQTKVKRGTVLDLLEQKGNWYKTKVNGREGWVSGDYITKTSSGSEDVNVKKAKTTANLNMRNGAGTSYRVIKTLPKGTEFEVIEEVNNEWVKMKHDGRIGYVHKQYMTYTNKGGTTVKPPTTDINNIKVIGKREVVKTDSLNVRTGPSTSYQKIGTLKGGEVVEVVSDTGGWSKIKYKGKLAYVSNSYLKDVSNSNNNGDIEASKPPTNVDSIKVISVKEVINTNSLNVRTGPSTSYQKIGSLSGSEKVEVVEDVGGWSKIKYKGRLAYASNSYLKVVNNSESKPSVPPTDNNDINASEDKIIGTKVATSAVNVRSGPSTSYKSLGVLAYDEKVNVLEDKNGWTKIQYKGGHGYVASSYLSALDTNGSVNNGDISNSDKVEGNVVYKGLNYTLQQHIDKQMERVAIGGNVISSSKPRMFSEKTVMNPNVRGFIPAELDDIEYFLNPSNFTSSRGMMQFLRIDKYREGISVSELNSYLNGLPKNNGKGGNVFYNQGQTFINAAKKYNIDLTYLVGHAMWETGYGGSTLAKGQTITTYKGEKLPEPVTVYNFYGIGAIDGSANVSGAEASYSNGWTSIEKTIEGSAEWISKNYIHSSKYNQNTIYKMKWNYDYTWHQYATDVNWANGISGIMSTLSGKYDNKNVLTYEVPSYK